MSKNRVSPKRGFCNPDRLPRGPSGRALCRECRKEVPKDRKSFCSSKCVDAWKLRSQPEYVRIKLFERDKGVCALCGTDCVRLVKDLETLDLNSAGRWSRSWFGREQYRKMLEQNSPLNARLTELGIPRHRYYGRRRYGIWDADHIVAVVEGGGECGLDNYRTLCCKCHKAETSKLRKRRANGRVLRVQLRPQRDVHVDVRQPRRHQDRRRQLDLFVNQH